VDAAVRSSKGKPQAGFDLAIVDKKRETGSALWERLDTGVA